MSKTKTKTIYYQQCRLTRQRGGAEQVMITYLPQKYAKIGRILKLKKTDETEWSNGWVVQECYNGKKPKLDAVLGSMDYKSWRDVTDV